MKKTILLLFPLLILVLQAFKSGDDNKISYSKQVAPILGRHCYGCHPADAAAKYNFPLTEYAMVKSVVDNGSLRESVLVKKTMPMRNMWSMGGDTLTKEELNVLDSWMVQGAPDN